MVDISLTTSRSDSSCHPANTRAILYLMLGRAACVAIFSSHGHVLTVRNKKGLYGLPGGKCFSQESPMRAARREVLEETGLRITGTLSRVLVANAGLHECFGYLYGEAISPFTPMLAEAGCQLEWRHPSQMDSDEARFPLFNREFFGILRGTGYIDVLPGVNAKKPVDPSEKFFVKMNMDSLYRDIAANEAFFENLPEY